MVEPDYSYLDRRIIPDSFDWKAYDLEEEHTRVHPAADYMDAVVDGFYAETEAPVGSPYPWDKAAAKGLRFRPEELTVYAGHSGSYKSMVQSQVALQQMRHDGRCLIASFEMRPIKTLMRMMRQAAGTSQPSIAFMKSFKAWSTGRLWLYDHFGMVEPRKVLAVCRFAAKELGCGHVFIDSLMKVMRKTDDYNEQKDFVAALCAFAQAHHAHAHLVAHTRKPQSDGARQGKFDVHGAGEIEKQADNVLIIQRNREETSATADFDGKEREPDVWIKVDKQRDAEYEGTLGLWFNPDSLCVVEQPNGHWPRINCDEKF